MKALSICLAWWNSLESVTTVGWIVKFAVPILAITAVILGIQESRLRTRVQAAERRPRTISPNQRLLFRTAIGSVTPEPISLAVITTTAEASDFGLQVSEALAASGFKVLLERPHGSGGDAPPGIRIQYPENKKPLADALDSAFRACGFQANRVEINTTDAGASIKITIGEKPVKF